MRIIGSQRHVNEGHAVFKLYKNRKPSLSLPNPTVMVRLGAQVLPRISEHSDWMLITEYLLLCQRDGNPTALLWHEILEQLRRISVPLAQII